MSGTFEFGKILGIMACQTLLKEIRIWATMLVASGVLMSCTLDEPGSVTSDAGYYVYPPIL